MKTAVGYPGFIRCSRCPEETRLTVDEARSSGWRVGWHPEQPSWCPRCWVQAVREMVFTQTWVDEPLPWEEKDDPR